MRRSGFLAADHWTDRYRRSTSALGKDFVDR